MPPARANSEPAHDSFAKSMSIIPLSKRIALTATGDSRVLVRFPPSPRTNRLESLRFVLSRKLPESPFRFLDILKRQSARFNEVRHYRLGVPAEKSQQVVDQSPLRGIPRDRRFENVEVTDLL